MKTRYSFGQNKRQLQTNGGDFGNTINLGDMAGCDWWDVKCKAKELAKKAETDIKTKAQEILPEIVYVKAEELIETKGQQFIASTKEKAMEYATQKAGEFVASKGAQDSAIKAGVERTSQELIAFKDAYRIAGLKGIRTQYPIIFWGGVSLSSLVGLAIAFRVGKLVVGKR